MYVYVVRNRGSDYIKIGRAIDPWARVRSLQTASPESLHLAGMVKCNTEGHAAHVEAVTHELLQAKRVSGEWFRVRGKVDLVLRNIRALADYTTKQFPADKNGEELWRVCTLTPDDLSTILSARELHVMQFYARGLRCSQISKELCLSAKTVSTYGNRIAKKLGITTRQVSYVALLLAAKLSPPNPASAPIPVSAIDSMEVRAYD